MLRVEERVAFRADRSLSEGNIVQGAEHGEVALVFESEFDGGDFFLGAVS